MGNKPFHRRAWHAARRVIVLTTVFALQARGIVECRARDMIALQPGPMVGGAMRMPAACAATLILAFAVTVSAAAAAEPRIRNVCTSAEALDALISAHQRGDLEAAMDARYECLGSVAVSDMKILSATPLEGFRGHRFCRAVIKARGRMGYVPLDSPLCPKN